ncbi:hypothetical protein R5R35_005784 [Gryllus longicercus]|uniref:DDE Tnp4 domain-containing protein n=1 Tax=Gryllus longicercus TaxID=2509291 RepID=A0AAN9VY78_9ORTH
MSIRDIESVEEVVFMDEIFDCEQPRRKKKSYRARVSPLEMYSDAEFRRKYRFSKEGAIKLIDLFGAQLKSDGRGGKLSPDLQILTALRCWGRNEVQDDSADLHGISQQSITNVCRRVALSIVQKRQMYIRMPANLDEELQKMNMFSDICGFRSVVGCIDCTHIRIPHVPGNEGHYYINRKNFPSLNVQVVCDASLKIMDIVARWYGSAHDSRIFNESALKLKFEGGQFHGRLLGDSGYECTPYLFTPVLRPRSRKEVRYNAMHVRTRNSVERCFGVLKSRFRCLQTGFRNSLENIKLYIVALAILHNIAIIFNEEEFPVEEEVVEEQELQPIQAVGRGAAVWAAFIEENF